MINNSARRINDAPIKKPITAPKIKQTSLSNFSKPILYLPFFLAREHSPTTYTNIHNITQRVNIFFVFIIPSWNSRPLLTFKCFKNPRGPSAALASNRAPPLRDAFQILAGSCCKVNLYSWPLIYMQVAALVAVASRSIPSARIFSRSAFVHIYFFMGICGPRIGRGATCSRGVLCARPRGLVRAYLTKFLPWFHDCTANVLPGLSNQPAALHASAAQFRRERRRFTLWSW